MNHRRLSTFFLVIFFLSGLSGLIYESIWTHYIKLLMGHAAYAQTLVLVLFMGGLAIGSVLASRWVSRHGKLVNPVLAYAVVECIIGIMALCFHGVFSHSKTWLVEIIFPWVNDEYGITAIKWLYASVLILPAATLLGATYPLLSTGLIRLQPEQSGRLLALLYFANSLGAAVGILLSGFVLIAAMGLPGTMLVAGLLNLFVALLAWSGTKLIDKHSSAQEDIAVSASSSSSSHVVTNMVLSETSLIRLMLGVAMLTGLSSFIYEIVWIRMLVLVLGSSSNAFELMLSAFITGLALGGFLIRRYVDRVQEPMRLLAWIQVWMGLAAMLSLVLYNELFEVMRVMMSALNRSDAGYHLFNLTSSAMAFAIMLPATLCAGMTLPLITHLLYARLHTRNEKAVGQVYAMNTVGAVLGVMAAVYVLMPGLGLKWALMVGAWIDIGLGVILFYAGIKSKKFHVGEYQSIYRRYAFPVLALLILVMAANADVSSHYLASGVYRQGMLLDTANTNVIYEKNGKSSTVHVLYHPKENIVSIRTNGKSDAAISLDVDEAQKNSKAPPGTFTGLGHRTSSNDEPTMILAFVLPYLYTPEATTVANIGFGSGLTVATALATPIQRIDSIEIEPAMIEGAKHFGKINQAAYTDPRSRIIIDDAKSFFAASREKYDIIISEPSNPWVSGTASLFTQEFYHGIKANLKPDGVFTQWIQAYETNHELLATVLKALNQNFDDYHLYVTYSDILLVAKVKGSLPPPRFDKIYQGSLKEFMRHIDAAKVEDIARRYLGSKSALAPWFERLASNANSDYFPLLDQGAAKARFKNQSADLFLELRNTSVPYLNTLDRVHQVNSLQKIDSHSSHWARVLNYERAMAWHAQQGVSSSRLRDGSGVQSSAVFSGGRAMDNTSRPVDASWVENNPEAPFEWSMIACQQPSSLMLHYLALQRMAITYHRMFASEVFAQRIKPLLASCPDQHKRETLRFYHEAAVGNWSSALQAVQQVSAKLGDKERLTQADRYLLEALVAFEAADWAKVQGLAEKHASPSMQILHSHALARKNLVPASSR